MNSSSVERGVAIWKHTAGTLTLLDTLCIPIYPCPDAAYAEACGAAHAVVLAAKYFAESASTAYRD